MKDHANGQNNIGLSPAAVLPESAMPYPRLCAHRGFSAALPENTMPSFGAAIALGAPEIEFDVRFTSNGVPVVCHDDRIDRVACGSGLVNEHTLEEIERLDAGSKFSPVFAGVTIPTLEEVLSKFSRHAVINLHLKPLQGAYPADKLETIVGLLDRYGQLDHVYLMGSPDVMKTALEVAPEIPRCMGAGLPGRKLEETAWQIVDRAIKWQCRKVQLFKPYFDDRMIDRAHENGILCNFFWSDEPEEAETLYQMGIDTVLTNNYLKIMPVWKRFLHSRAPL